MYAIATLFTALAFLCAVSAAGAALYQLRTFRTGQVPNKDSAIPPLLTWVERGQLAATLLVTGASLVLAAAFAVDDFSLVYVAGHSDRALPLFYKLTAFWAGQEGSLLFWAWSVALCGSFFGAGKVYARQDTAVKLWFWAFFLAIMAFFLLLLSSWSNPFIVYDVTPRDGAGLNPMLQNPGMIFHPPLLFLGYGGFTVPGCLALAYGLTQGATRSTSRARRSGKNDEHLEENLSWSAATRPFIMLAWLFLSAGIILGGWWAYMELGWGGYWGWDPVENASLVPWLIATAYLHTSIVETRRGKLMRANIFLMALTTISAFFATYIVRGNVVRSVHAFGDSAAGIPLLLFTAVFLVLAIAISVRSAPRGEALESPLSREGLLSITAWTLLALAGIILLATLWPVLSRIWSVQSVGLGPSFYNYACLPFFALLALMLAFCPWVGWDGTLRRKLPVYAILLLMVCSAAVLVTLGLAKPLALMATAAGVGIIATVSMLLSARPDLLRTGKATLAAHGVHLGFALIVLGISFSGPYKTEYDLAMLPGQGYAIGDYAFTLQTVRGGDSFELEPNGAALRAMPGSSPSYIYQEALVSVSRNGETTGMLRPQLRLYAKMPGMPSTEVSTLFSLGNELYATFLGMNENTAVLRISINPLVNWIWVGGVLLCLFPLAGIGVRTKPGTDRGKKHA